MSQISKAFEEELKGVDAALRRAALKAKQEAERNGTPYVVYRDSNNGRFVENKQLDVKSK